MEADARVASAEPEVAAYDEDDGLAWYAAAAAGESDEEEGDESEEGAQNGGEEVELEDDEEPKASLDPYLMSDPYLTSDPYAEAVSDPYADAVFTDPYGPAAEEAGDVAPSAPSIAAPTAGGAVAGPTPPAAGGEKRPLAAPQDPVVDLTAEVGTHEPVAAAAAPALEQPARKVQRTREQAQTKPPARPPLAPAPPKPQLPAAAEALGPAHERPQPSEVPVPRLEPKAPPWRNVSDTPSATVPVQTPAGPPSAAPELPPAEPALAPVLASVPVESLATSMSASAAPEVAGAALASTAVAEQLPLPAQQTSQAAQALLLAPSQAPSMESAPEQVMSAEPVLPEHGVGVSAVRDMPVNAGVDLADVEEVMPLALDANEQTLLNDLEMEESWDARVLVVRQGQVHIELQHQNPQMRDAGLLRFCDWLDQQMPLVVENFPYVKRSGAYVDLSDNLVGPEGLDKLFRVLRDHRVPCVVMKAYRNLLDDSIVDTLIEYLYTQPESFPMHGIHISHNNISDKGAFRLIRAAALCGHYPRYTSRLPLWLRLEANDIKSPQKIISECHEEGFNVCLMGNGLCSRPDCNHYSGVHVQLPYFFHQGRKGADQYQKERAAGPKAASLQPAAVAKAPAPQPVPVTEPEPATAPAPVTAPAPETTPEEGEDEAAQPMPDWKKKPVPTIRKASLMVPAPKKQGFRPPGPGVVTAPGPAPTTEEVSVGPDPTQPPGPPPEAFHTMGMQHVVRPSLAAPPPPGHGADSRRLEAAVISLGTSPKAGFRPPGGLGAGPIFVPEGTDAREEQGGATAAGSWEADGGRGGRKGGGRGGGRGRPRGGGLGYREEYSSGWDRSKGWGGGKGGRGWHGSGGKGADSNARWGGGSRMWMGPTLQSKAKKDIRLAEGEGQLGFEWRFMGEGQAPLVLFVDPASKAGEVAKAHDYLLRINGLDASMFNERQINDMLKQRPLALRFGDV